MSSSLAGRLAGSRIPALRKQACNETPHRHQDTELTRDIQVSPPADDAEDSKDRTLDRPESGAGGRGRRVVERDEVDTSARGFQLACQLVRQEPSDHAVPAEEVRAVRVDPHHRLEALLGHRLQRRRNGPPRVPCGTIAWKGRSAPSDRASAAQ